MNSFKISMLGSVCIPVGMLLAYGCSGTIGGLEPSPAGGPSSSGAGGGLTGTGGNAGISSGGNGSSGSTGSGGSAGAGNAADPNAAGVRPLHLLSTREYLATVRDLLGDTTLDPSSLPTGDEDRSAVPSFAFKVDHPIATQDANLLQSAGESLARNAVAHLTTLLPCATPPAASGEASCLNQFLTTFMPKLYRRPLSTDEIGALNTLYQVGRSTLRLGFNDSIGLLLEASLQSPEFLYHREWDPGPVVHEGSVVRLGNYELANRLSYFLWGSMPDTTLFAAAAAGQLADPAQVEAQVRRMLQDPKTLSTVVDFVEDWLDIDVLPDMSKDETVYPMYNDALVSAMTSEVEQFVTGIVMNGSARFADLLTSRSSYANQPLAALYGLSGVTGNPLRPVTLNAAQRSGLLTTAAFLATTGDAAESNPPRRGKAIYTKLLCQQLRPLPAVVPPPAPASAGGTLRQRMEQHDMNGCTAGCHNVIEPFGFAFEEFGGIGEFRTTDNGLPVDASGTVELDGQMTSFHNATELVAALTTSQTVQDCFATQWLRYGFGRFETDADQASLQSAAAAFERTSGDVRELLVGLALSRTFRYRTPADGEVLP